MPRLYSTRDEWGTLTKWNRQVYNQSARRNTCPTAPFSATNPTWADVRLKLCLCSAMPATNCLSCCRDRGGTIIWDMYHYMVFILGRIIRTPRSCSSHWIHKQFVCFFYRHKTAQEAMNPVPPIPRAGKPLPTTVFPLTTHNPDNPPQMQQQKHEPNMNGARPQSVQMHANSQSHAYF